MRPADRARILAACLWLAGSLACVSATPALGSPDNPVRAHSFLGELEYLARLRCPDESRPHARRLGHSERGPYGNMLIAYRVRCIYRNHESIVFFDAFHADFVETAAVPGFVLAGPPERSRLFWMEK
jgi:hypothetical protein